MTNRRGFFGKLLGGAIASWLGSKVVKAEPVSLTYPEWRGLRGLTDDGALNSRLWFPSKEGVYFYDSKTGKRTPVTPYPPTPENE